jgi:hypothetical protein
MSASSVGQSICAMRKRISVLPKMGAEVFDCSAPRLPVSAAQQSAKFGVQPVGFDVIGLP